MVNVYFIATLMILQGFLFLHVQPWYFYYFPYFRCFDNGNYNVSWTCNRTTHRIYVEIHVTTTGWVGFGLTNNAPSNMTDYDLAVGGVDDNGTCFVQDYLVINQTTLQYDTQQDWTVVNCTEENGTTIIVICRAKNTSDANDTAVQEGMPIYIIWAYHNTSDAVEGFPQDIGNGSRMGYNYTTFIPAGGASTSSAAGGATTSSAAGVATSPSAAAVATTSTAAGGATASSAAAGGASATTVAGGGGASTIMTSGGGVTKTAGGGGGGVSATSTKITFPSSSVVVGVSISDWKAKEGECEDKCEGAGGPFEIVRTCEPKASSQCKNVTLTGTSEDCVKYCPSNAVKIAVSTLILAIGMFLSSFSFH